MLLQRQHDEQCYNYIDEICLKINEFMNEMSVRNSSEVVITWLTKMYMKRKGNIKDDRLKEDWGNY